VNPSGAAAPPYYGWLLIGGLALSLVFWVRLARKDPRLLALWLSALLGAFVVAKLLYVLAEGWRDWGTPDAWHRLRTGKSIVGALFGGYFAVEGAKRILGYRGATGDWFALIVPAGIALGRAGCWLNGCCLGRVCANPGWWTVNDAQGIPRWPSVPLELGFNVLALIVLAGLRRHGRFPGNLFHLYLIAYGLFRGVHEFARDTPRLFGPFSGYALAAFGLALFGAVRFRQRLQATALTEGSPDNTADRPLQPPRPPTPHRVR